MTQHHNILDRIADEREVIAKRRREISESLAKLSAEETQIRERENELDVAERTIKSLLLMPESEPQQAGAAVANLLSSLDPGSKRKRGKPAHLPPILEMADRAFDHFEESGKCWITAREIAKFAQEHYWPDANSENFQGQLWRAASRGDLLKKGSCYARKGSVKYEGLAHEATRPFKSNSANGLHP